MATQSEINALNSIRYNYGDKIAKASRVFNVPERYLYALIYKESGGQAAAVSETGDYGLAQLQPKTAMMLAKERGWKGYETVEAAKKTLAENPGQNIALGAMYYSRALQKSGGDPVYAYALYNGGIDRDQELPEVYSRIKDRSFSRVFDEAGRDTTSNIITNAEGFKNVFDIMGVDPYAEIGPSPQPAPASPMGASMDSYERFRRGVAGESQQPETRSSLEVPREFYPRGTTELKPEDIENPVVAGYRGFGEQMSMGYWDPLAGEARGEGVPAKVGEGLGRGAAIGMQFTPIGAATRPLAAVPYVGRALAPAVAMGLYEGAHATPEGTGSDAASQFAQRLSQAGHGAAMGAALGGLHMIPGVRQLAQRPIEGTVLDTGIFGGMRVGERVMNNEPIDWGNILAEDLPMVIGMRAGGTVGGLAEGGLKPSPKPEPKPYTPGLTAQAYGEAPVSRAELPANIRREMGLKVENKPLERTPAEREAAQPIRRRAADKGVVPVEGEPATEVMAAYINGDLPLEGALRAMRENPAMFKLSDQVQQQVGELASRVNAGEANLPEARSQWRDRRRFLREATGGEAENPAYNSALRVGEMSEMFKERVAEELQQRQARAVEGIKPNSAEDRAVGRFLNEWDRSIPIQEFASSERGQKILEGVKKPDLVVRAAEEGAKNLAAEADIRDATREIFAKGEEGNFESMNRLDAYFPHTQQEVGFIRNPKKWAESMVRIPKSADAKPKRVYSPREMQRKGTLNPDDIEWSAHKVFGRYSADTARVLSNSIALNAGENLADAYRAAGLKNTGNAISEVNQISYGGKMTPAQAELMKTPMGAATVQAALGMKQAFNGATYALNIPFMALRQWTSVGLIGAHGEVTPADVAGALKDAATNKRIWREFDNSYTGWIKGNRRGTFTKQGSLRTDFMSESLTGEGGVRGAVDALRRAADAPVSGMEKMTGRFAFALAERIGKKAGLSGSKLQGFKSDVAGLTQSYYDSLNRAPVLNGPFTNLLFPAQGYAVEVANTYRSTLRGETGAQQGLATRQQRVGRAMTAAATTYMLNLIYTYMMSYKGDKPVEESILDPELHFYNLINTGSGAIPYLGAVVPGGPGDGMTMPAQRVKEMEDAIGSLADGDWEKALMEIGRKQIVAGGTAYRVTEAIRMYEEGAISEDDLPAAMVMGWYTTESGKEYLRSRVHRGPVTEMIFGDDRSGGSRRPTRPSRPRRPQRPRRSN